MAYVARVHLKWGDGTIAPGEPVPEEEGRDYASLVRHGRIAEVGAPENMSDEELVTEVARLTKQVDELTAPVQVPDDVTLGETQGWPVDAESGEPYKLPDEVRQLISDLETEVAVLHGELGRETADTEGSQPGAKASGEGSEDDPDSTEASTESGDTEKEPESTSSGAAGLPEGVKPLGGGYYELPDGSKVRGRKALDDALAASAKASGEGSEE